MGSDISKFYNKIKSHFQTNEPKRILLLGLDAAGKTTILYRLKLGETITTIPTLGFNLQQIQYKNLTFVIWDIGGQDKIRKLWNHYFDNSIALIFVVDSSDHNRIDEASEELHKLMNNEILGNIPILVYANKQDQIHSLNTIELAKKMDLLQIKSRKWYIQSCSALNGEGIDEGLDWLAKILSKNNKSI
jgi:small GTP-binding protein